MKFITYQNILTWWRWNASHEVVRGSFNEEHYLKVLKAKGLR